MLRKNILLLIVGVMVISYSYAQSTSDQDKKEIEKVIGYYFEGSRTDNPETLKKAFHPDATLKYAKEGEYTSVPISKYFTYFTNTKTREFEGEIHYIDVVGTAANVKLSVTYDTYRFNDYMNMIKLNNGWKIVSKISYRENL